MADQGEAWTIPSLKEHLEAQIRSAVATLSAEQRSAKEMAALALAASKEAINKAELSVDKRLDLLNESKATILGLSAGFLTKETYDVQHKALEAIVDTLRQRMDRNEGKGQGTDKAWAYLLAAAGLALSAVLVFLALR